MTSFVRFSTFSFVCFFRIDCDGGGRGWLVNFGRGRVVRPWHVIERMWHRWADGLGTGTRVSGRLSDQLIGVVHIVVAERILLVAVSVLVTVRVLLLVSSVLLVIRVLLVTVVRVLLEAAVLLVAAVRVVVVLVVVLLVVIAGCDVAVVWIATDTLVRLLLLVVLLVVPRIRRLLIIIVVRQLLIVVVIIVSGRRS